MKDYSVTVHYKDIPDYTTKVRANSKNSAKVFALISSLKYGISGDLSKQPTVVIIS
jgi:hypothetical protein